MGRRMRAHRSEADHDDDQQGKTGFSEEVVHVAQQIPGIANALSVTGTGVIRNRPKSLSSGWCSLQRSDAV